MSFFVILLIRITTLFVSISRLRMNRANRALTSGFGLSWKAPEYRFQTCFSSFWQTISLVSTLPSNTSRYFFFANAITFGLWQIRMDSVFSLQNFFVLKCPRFILFRFIELTTRAFSVITSFAWIASFVVFISIFWVKRSLNILSILSVESRLFVPLRIFISTSLFIEKFTRNFEKSSSVKLSVDMYTYLSAFSIMRLITSLPLQANGVR